MDTQTLTHAVEQANDRLDGLLDAMEQADTLTDLMDLARDSIVLLQGVEHSPCDIYVSTPALLRTGFDGVPPQIIYLEPEYDSSLMDAVFWIQGDLEGRDCVVVIAGYAKSGTAH